MKFISNTVDISFLMSIALEIRLCAKDILKVLTSFKRKISFTEKSNIQQLQMK